MSKLLIEGNRKLNGIVSIQGSKNSVLPILAASVLCSGKCILHNCPNLLDVDFSIKILEYLGAIVIKDGNDLLIDTSTIEKYDIPDYLMKEMRSSIIFLGAILSRLKRAKLFFPGGCELGPRPIDFHLNAFRQMGAIINEEGCALNCYANKRLNGTQIDLPLPSVGATENIMIVATLANGITIINNAAREPEICDLARFLNACGAKIFGAGESLLAIEGVKKLYGTEHSIIPDRIVASTFMSSAAITGGEILLKNVVPEHLHSVISVFEEMGCEIDSLGKEMNFKSPKRLKSIKKVVTKPYPGFPTDTQAILLAVSSIAQGESTFIESIFKNRFGYTNELLKFGANIDLIGKSAVVNGTPKLFGANVKAFDLRGAASLIIAALGAFGNSEIQGLKHLDRGYENIEEKLSNLGAIIKRV
ncbi:MAG: UDP-N-acetylglucosamine 1-carboxyvinyltransferase [Eubacteriales bacterium SKADARSKE-1]|nr:UDP-N-acetylglucosamine 1-carboxyvinyltransferase [Eubacteriales bacterium SKADARSKE-1]